MLKAIAFFYVLIILMDESIRAGVIIIKKILKSIIFIAMFIIFAALTFIYFQNKFIDNQPKKAKLVYDLGGIFYEELQ